MVDFGSDYWNTLDRTPTKTLKISTRDLGISSKMGEVVQNLKADITAGATHVEIGFMGEKKGSLGQGKTTPEMFGTEKRKEIRRLSKLNEVSVSTHASIGVSNMSGIDMQNKRFSDTTARESLNELKRTIDFAGEACGGGAVVVHTGEYPREVSEYKEFEPEEGIKKEEMVILVDNETGQFRGAVNKGEIAYVPEFIKNKGRGGKYLDWMGRPTDDELKARPVVIEETGRVKFQKKKWDDFVLDAKEDIKNNPKKWKGFQAHEVAAKKMHLTIQRAELERAEPFAYHYMKGYERAEEQAKKLKELQKYYENAEKGGDIERLKQHFAMQGQGYNPSKDGNPSDFLKTAVHDAELGARREMEGFAGYAKQIEQIEDMTQRVEPISKEGKSRTAKNMARAANYAIRKEAELKRAGQDVKPIFIAPENIFPEMGYGSHPQEIKDIIISSRKELEKQLVAEGKSKAAANKLAEDHIKATFDIGHANVWKRFFREKQGETIEQRDEEFNKWLMREVDDLNKAGVIGHVHLSDNFGYYDEHLTPGAGNAPVKEFIDKMKKNGFNKPMIVEWGAQSTEHEPYGAMIGAWARLADSPMYRIDGLQQSWGDIEQSGYFGRTSSPNFTIGKYSPGSNKDWNAWGWSEAPIE